VEILSTEVVSEFTALGGVIFVIALLAGIVGLALLIVGITELSTVLSAAGAIGLLFSGITGYVSMGEEFNVEYKEHKVLVSDFNDSFLSGYEIIEQDGKILTIKEKEGDE